MKLKIEYSVLQEIIFYLNNNCNCVKNERIKKIIKHCEQLLENESNKETLRRLFKLYKTETNEEKRKEYLDLYIRFKNGDFKDE